MRALIVEDNPKKRDALSDYYSREFPQDDLGQSSALISGLRAARDQKPDLIMLDMTLPNYSAEENPGVHAELMPFAGREFIFRINRMNFSTKIIIVSMFETFGVAPRLITLESLDKDLREKYSRVYAGAIHYSPANAEWRLAIKQTRESLGERQ